MLADPNPATSTSEIKQILPIEYVRDIVYQKVVVGKISKTKVGPVLEYLKNVEVYQNNDLEHLKRVNKDPKEANMLNILLCCEEDREKLDLSKLKDLSITEFDVVEVSKYPPYTKEQYEKFKEPWPITFKKKAMDIIEFTASEKLKIEGNMRKAIELAKQSYENGNRFNACILVDPNQKDKILKEATDNTQRNIASVSHCVIKMANSFGEYCKSISKNTVKIKKSRNESVIQEVKPVEESKEPEEQDPELVNKRKAEVDIESYFSSEDYYYCLGLDLYIVMEPCVMCAMALVHSRIARVFYSMPYQDFGQGGLNEKIQINNLQGLNHRYKVFYNVLNNETVDVCKGLNAK